MYDMYDICDMYDMYDMYDIHVRYMCDIKLSHIPVICMQCMYIYISYFIQISAIYLSYIYHMPCYTRYICISNVILSIHVHLTYRIYLQTNKLYIYIFPYILCTWQRHTKSIRYVPYTPYTYIYIYMIYIYIYHIYHTHLAALNTYILILLHTTYIDLCTIQPFLSFLELPTSPGHQWRPSTRSWPASQTHPLLPPSLFCFLRCCLSRSGISWMCAWSLPESWNRIFTTTK